MGIKRYVCLVCGVSTSVDDEVVPYSFGGGGYASGVSTAARKIRRLGWVFVGAGPLGVGWVCSEEHAKRARTAR